jgi:hypothetical protein
MSLIIHQNRRRPHLDEILPTYLERPQKQDHTAAALGSQ